VAISDAELARRVGDGDGWAEEALYRRHLGTLLGTAKRLLGSTAEAEDVVQDAFAEAFSIWGQLREPDRVKQWLLKITIHKVHRRFRRRKLLRALGFTSPPDDATLEALAGEEAPAEARAELALLDRALQKLPTPERLAWMLRYVEGKELREVAYECSCSLATVKRRIAHAHARVCAEVELEEFSDE
jgi:RNA polymerase sigma-70 factor (ECF subfamily)